MQPKLFNAKFIYLFFLILLFSSTTEPFSPAALGEREAQASREQMRQRWESLRLELKTKLQLLQKTLEQDQKQLVKTSWMLLKCKVYVVSSKLKIVCFSVFQIYSRTPRVTTTGSLFRGESQADKSSLKTLYDSFRQTVEDMSSQVSLFS